MAKHLVLVFTNPEEGREAEFNAWYDDVHLPDVLSVAGFSAAQRFVAATGARGERPDQQYLAVYEVDTDDLPAALEALRGAAKDMHIDESMAPETVVTYAFSAVSRRQESTA